MSDSVRLIITISMLIIFVFAFGSIALSLYDSVTVVVPRIEAFCLDQGFSDWAYASRVTGVSGSIFCIDKGNLKYFTFEAGEYYNVKDGVGE